VHGRPIWVYAHLFMRSRISGFCDGLWWNTTESFQPANDPPPQLVTDESTTPVVRIQLNANGTLLTQASAGARF